MFKFIRMLCVPLMVSAPIAARADDYLIAPGDGLEMSVVGVPALHRRGAVGADGKISFPSLGDIEAAGRSREQLQDDVRRLLVERNVASNPDVAVEVIEYRPIYVDGDVAKPGEYRYSPGMTVRTAAAVAGGFGSSEARGVGPLMEAAGAQGDVGAILVDLAGQRATVARLNAELAQRATLTVSQPPESAVDADVFQDIVKIETEQLTADRNNRQKEKAYVERMVQVSQRELDYLNDASQQQQRTLEQQSTDVARARDLLQRGIGTITRSEDEQRAIALLQWQILDVKARIQQAQKELETFTQQMATYDDTRKIRLLDQLRVTLSEVGKLEYRLAAAREKVRLGGGVRLKPEGSPQATIYRAAHGAQRRIDADQDTALLPGDVLELTVPTGSPYAMRSEGQ